TVFLKKKEGERELLGTRGLLSVMTDAQGQFAVEGLMRGDSPSALEIYGTASPDFLRLNPDAVRQYQQVVQQAVNRSDPDTKVNIPVDGAVIYAVDMARGEDYAWTINAARAEQHVTVVCFPCRTFSLMGLTDPRGYIPLTDVTVLNAATISPPFQFGRSLTDARQGDESENLATVWADPSLHILMTLGVGFQGKRLVLVNNTLDNPQGDGFVMEDLTTLPSMVLQGTRDMWNLTETRVRKLARNGVNTPRIQALHNEARTLIDTAEQALAALDYRGYRVASEKGWALESKAYGGALDMINNMIHGVLFYLALLLPLSYCLERLLVASESIKKRIAWILVIFSISFFLLAVVHPAFRFTMTPLLVLLAFVILVLVVLVSILILGKMDAVLQEHRVAAIGRHEDQVRRGGVAVRALDLGMSNIRRRPQRGFLTGLSVVMVTFILLSFTSMVPVTSISRLAYPRGTATYRGLLARDRAWKPLPNALEESLQRNFGEEGFEAGVTAVTNTVVAARAWFFSDDTGLLSQIDLVAGKSSKDRPSASATVPVLLCLEPAEPQVTGLDKSLIAGRWFQADDEHGIILSSYVAQQLGYSADDIGAVVRVFGENLTLTGLIDAQRFESIRDVDGEPLTPVDFVLQQETTAEAAGSGKAPQKPDTLEEYIHYSATQIAIVPYRYGRRLGATVRSVAVRVPGHVDVAQEAEGYAKRSNLTVLGADEGGITLYAALDTSQLSAAWQVVIPMFLGFIMILGTMLGSVYERKGEIFVYNSIGLSPTNVSSLFLAESAVYAIVGAGLGYLLGQASSKILQATGMLSGLTLNYTAGSTIFVTLLAMAMVFLSAIYPARKAFRAAVADVEGAPDSESIDKTSDTIAFYLPFVATPHHVEAMQAYLAEFLESIQGVTVGLLAVESLQAIVEQDEHGAIPALKFRAWMAPFDLGVSHDVMMRIVYRADRGVHQYHLTATRFSGDRQNWHRLTPRFVTTMRKQLLMWRVLGSAEHTRYMQRGEALFGFTAAASESVQGND
ncbi:MAG: ABC transporter permease, partial [Verrucomicrobia bacterium]|nr:ABC transporter permease [Verrucomicrobiota bacterium]